jgi:hypothetical protein
MNNQTNVPTRFKLTAESLAPPPGVNGVPAGILSKLKKMEGKGFPTEETFLAEVAILISAEELKRFQRELVNRADVVPQLILYFSAGSAPELLETRFYHKHFAPWGRHSVRGKDEGAHAGSASFQWSPALKVLAAYLLWCAASGRRSPGDSCPTLAGERSSPAASLNYAMSKKPEWIKDMFGEDSDSHPYLLDLISRTNPDLKRVGPVILSLNRHKLPPERISVFAGDRQVYGAEEIEQMASAIERSLKSNGAKKARFELTITGDLGADWTPDLRRAIEERLAELKIKNSQIIAVKKGSIKLFLELPPDEAERLFWAVHSGELDDFGVISGAHIPSPHVASDVEDWVPDLDATPRASQEQQVSAPETPRAGVRVHKRPRLVYAAKLCNAFEYAWRIGSSPRIESFIEEWPEADQPRLLRELVTLEVRYRHARGETCTIEDYQTRFPGLDRSWLESVLADLSSDKSQPDFTRADSDTSSVETKWSPRELKGGRGEEIDREFEDNFQDARGSDLPVVPGYELLNLVGHDGMGIVYRARQSVLGRIVAIKMPHHNWGRDHIHRFVVEAKCLARMRHKNVLNIYDMVEHIGVPFLFLEYMPGGTLKERLDRMSLQPTEAAELVRVLAGALQYVHSQGIVHRNLKPSIILFDADGTAKISSFTLAKHEGESIYEEDGMIVGSPSHMAPEQARGDNRKIGPPADIWALGVILYQCLTGKLPFSDSSIMETIVRTLNDDPVPPRHLVPGIPKDLEDICLKCLNKDARYRYASAAALAEDLRLFLEDSPITARPAGVLKRGWKWLRRHPAAVALGIGALLGLLLGIGLAGPLLSSFRG